MYQGGGVRVSKGVSVDPFPIIIYSYTDLSPTKSWPTRGYCWYIGEEKSFEGTILGGSLLVFQSKISIGLKFLLTWDCI